MARIKIASLRSLSDDDKGSFVDRKYSADEEQVAAYIREGWATEWSAGSDGMVQTDGGDGDDGGITDDLTDGQGDGGGSDGTGAGGV